MTLLAAQTIIASAGLLSAAVVAARGRDGWGWILFVTVIIAA